MRTNGFNLFSEIKYYLKLKKGLEAHLLKHADDWQKFQEMFDLTVDKLYDDILQFEKENIGEHESEIYRRKKIFEKRYRHYFVCGEYIKWSLEKPFGYAGDFKIIDEIYQNHPCTSGFNRLWDNWFLQLAASKAVRERKEDFKKYILKFIGENSGKDIRIMNLACGPAREIKELRDEHPQLLDRVTFDCYDLDPKALNYAKRILDNTVKVNFYEQNAIRLALKKDITKEVHYSYDLIYSTGLFDYFDARVASRLVKNLRRLIKRNGIMLIANMRDKYSNQSAGWMEWVAEWYLIYRSETEFKKIFIDAGFLPKELNIIPQNSKVMQYCFAR
jgi:2-polyprenyl-3-methyl-5-hydroxy-6-metoxy-1,4-benzoquinol methylase